MDIGNNSARVIDIELEFDPAEGITEVWIYEGSEEALKDLAAGFVSKGNKAHIYTHVGPVKRMRVTFARRQTSGEEVPIDLYEFETDLAQESIWSNPKVIDAAGNDDLLAGWKEDFKTHLKNNTPPSQTGFATAEGASTKKLELYTLLLRGQEAVEVERLVLKRSRTYTSRYVPQQFLEPIPTIYSGARLAAVFDIPAFISRRFPAAPTIRPDYTFWGWKKRRDATRIQIGGRTEETTDWVFAAWSQLPHNIDS
jgi:hypothetical protein